MRHLLTLAGVAALAISAPALAQGHGGGGHGGGGGGNPHQGGGGGNPFAGGGNPRAGPGGRGAGPVRIQAPRPERAPRAVQAQARPRPERPGHGRSLERRAPDIRHAERQDRALRRVESAREARTALPAARYEPGRDRPNSGWNDGFRSAEGGCPPGLAKKNNGCLPPGQARKLYALGERVPRGWYDVYNLPGTYRDVYYDSPDYAWRYDDSGYIYGVDRQSNLVDALIPLLGGGFGVGQALPAGYDAYNLPYQYRDLYQDGDDAAYRYGDDAIYQVDPRSGTIESVVALLTGGGLGLGQALPDGYDAYNLPMRYRDEYQDGPDSIYRYADGNIYQADAKTQIIQAVISALT